MKKKERCKKDKIDVEYLDMMVYNFNYAIDNKSDVVYIGYIILNDYLKEFWIKPHEWIKAIDLLINGAIEIEEYEYCNQLKEIKEKLAG